MSNIHNNVTVGARPLNWYLGELCLKPEPTSMQLFSIIITIVNLSANGAFEHVQYP